MCYQIKNCNYLKASQINKLLFGFLRELNTQFSQKKTANEDSLTLFKL